MSATDGKMLGTAPIGEGCDGVAFDPATGLVYASNGEGTLTVLKETAPGTYGVVETVPRRRAPGRWPSTRRRTASSCRRRGSHRRRLLRPKSRARGPSPCAGSFEILVVGRP